MTEAYLAEMSCIIEHLLCESSSIATTDTHAHNTDVYIVAVLTNWLQNHTSMKYLLDQTCPNNVAIQPHAGLEWKVLEGLLCHSNEEEKLVW